MNIFWTAVSLTGYALTLLLIPAVLLNRRKQPAATIAWIMAIIILPYFGAILFLFFGINRVERRALQRQVKTQAFATPLGDVNEFAVSARADDCALVTQMMRLAETVSGDTATDRNRIAVHADTEETFHRIETAIRSAKTSIDLEYYIWQPDRSGTRLRDLLIERASEGIQIRFLYDSIGSLWLSRGFLRPMKEAGIQVAPFLPGATLRERWSLNLRSHRKIAIVDGRVGFTGGMNIGDEYLGRNPSIGFWRDTHLEIYGPTVRQLQKVFAEDWFYATGQDISADEEEPDVLADGDTTAQVIASGPYEKFDSFMTLMFSAIGLATDRILLATSYFIPPPALVRALQAAACRGVRVRLLLPEHAAYFWTVMAGRSYFETLLEAGVEIHEYQKGLLHSKTLTVDGEWSLVGTPNFDARSLLLNFEVGVVLYGRDIAQQLENQFEGDLEDATTIELEAWRKRPRAQMLIESSCRLFAPVL